MQKLALVFFKKIFGLLKQFIIANICNKYFLKKKFHFLENFGKKIIVGYF